MKTALDFIELFNNGKCTGSSAQVREQGFALLHNARQFLIGQGIKSRKGLRWYKKSQSVIINLFLFKVCVNASLDVYSGDPKSNQTTSMKDYAYLLLTDQ